MEKQKPKGRLIDRLKLGLLSRFDGFFEAQKRKIDSEISNSANLLYGAYLNAIDTTFNGEIERTGLRVGSYLSGIDESSGLARSVLIARALRSIKNKDGILDIEIAVSYEPETTPSVTLLFTKNNHDPGASINGAVIVLALPIRVVGKPIILSQRTYFNMLEATVKAQSVIESLG